MEPAPSRLKSIEVFSSRPRPTDFRQSPDCAQWSRLFSMASRVASVAENNRRSESTPIRAHKSQAEASTHKNPQKAETFAPPALSGSGFGSAFRAGSPKSPKSIIFHSFFVEDVCDLARDPGRALASPRAHVLAPKNSTVKMAPFLGSFDFLGAEPGLVGAAFALALASKPAV